MFYQPEKFPDPAWFRQFNRESVLLIDADTDQRVLAVGEKKDVKISLSHFGTAPVENGELTWKTSDDATTLCEGRIDRLQAESATIADRKYDPAPARMQALFAACPRSFHLFVTKTHGGDRGCRLRSCCPFAAADRVNRGTSGGRVPISMCGGEKPAKCREFWRLKRGKSVGESVIEARMASTAG
jgi:hypothetical protein